MKRKRILLCIICSVLLLFSMASLTVYAHPGRLDSNGGHNDYINGGYHYHNGDSNEYYSTPPENDSSSEDSDLTPLYVTCICTLIFLVVVYFTWKESIKPRTIPQLSSPSPYPPTESPPPTREFQICHTIWLCTYHISRHCGFTNRAFAQGHIWATLLYITAKHIRDQAIIDQIYSHFESAASDVADGEPYPPSIISLVRHGYKQFAPILNASGIDPRSPQGIQELWDLIKKEDFKQSIPHPSAIRAYFDYVRILISNVSTYHHADDQPAPQK